MASPRRCADVAGQLIGHGADLNVECKDFDAYYEDVMWTPVHVAISKGSFPVAMTLLQHGANPNALDNLGKTALHLASYRRGITEVELLLKYGANMGVRDKNGWTPLHEAAYWGSVRVVVVLLNRGANPHAQM
jgi:ankyrin repeat protein